MQSLLQKGLIFRKKGYYYNFLLTDAELRVICDSILFAKQLPVDIVRSIFRKLIPETSPRRKSYLMNVEYLVNITRSENPFLYEVLEQIDLAIRQNRKVIVYPCTLNIDKGFDYFEEYLIDPFYIVTDKNRYSKRQNSFRFGVCCAGFWPLKAAFFLTKSVRILAEHL